MSSNNLGCVKHKPAVHQSLVRRPSTYRGDNVDSATYEQVPNNIALHLESTIIEPDFEVYVYPILIIPELKYMASEALYSQNTIRLAEQNHYGPSMWPPLNVRNHVRQLELDIWIFQPSIVDWLLTVATGSTRLDQLQRIQLNYKASSRHDRDCKSIITALDSVAPIQFSTHVLKVRYRHMFVFSLHDFDRGKGDDWEMRVLDKLAILGKHENLNIKLERYYLEVQWPGVPVAAVYIRE